MNNFNPKNHWENIYQNKGIDEVSWYQPIPKTSLAFIANSKLDKNAKIIDVGGGDSFLVDHLLDLKYSNITVLDISSVAIERAKKRLGHRAKKINWIVSNMLDFRPNYLYDYWHDRAAFHFLTHPREIHTYEKLVSSSIAKNGVLAIGTFSENGPTKCSGIPIQQYTGEKLSKLFAKNFTKNECITENHKTPFNTAQNFLYCNFIKA